MAIYLRDLSQILSKSHSAAMSQCDKVCVTVITREKLKF